MNIHIFLPSSGPNMNTHYVVLRQTFGRKIEAPATAHCSVPLRAARGRPAAVRLPPRGSMGSSL